MSVKTIITIFISLLFISNCGKKSALSIDNDANIAWEIKNDRNK